MSGERIVGGFAPEKPVFAVLCILTALSALLSGSIYSTWSDLFGIASVICLLLSLAGNPAPALMSVWPAWLLAGSMYLSALWSLNLNLTLNQAFFFTVFAVFSYITAYSSGGGRANFVLKLLVLASAAVSLYGIYQYAFGLEKTADYLRAYGASEFGLTDKRLGRALAALGYRRAFSTLVSPNALACYLAAALPAGMALLWRSRSAVARAAYAACTVAGIAALLLTKSVGGLAAFAAGTAVFLTAAPLSTGGGRLRRAAWTLALVAAVCAAGYFVLSERAGGFLGVGRSYAERLNYFEGALGAFYGAPFTGHGAGTFNLSYMPQIKPGADETRFAHNVALQTLSETGLAGFAVLAVVFAAFFAKCVRGIRRDPADPSYHAALAGGAAFLVHNMADFTFYVHDTAVIFWLYFGLVSRPDEGPEPSRNPYMAVTAAATIALVFSVFYGMSMMASWRHVAALSSLSAKDITTAGMARSRPVPEDAILLAEESVSLKPYDDGYRSFLAYLYEGAAYANGAAYAQKAEEQYKKAIKLNPEYPYHRRDLGILYEKMGRMTDARRSFEEALRLYPANPDLARLLAESEN